MNIETKFNIGDTVFLLHAHVQSSPIYTKSYIFKNKNGSARFTIESVEIRAGDKYCNINYRFKDFHEMFIPSEYNIFGSLEEATDECKKRNIKSLKMFRNLPNIFGRDKIYGQDTEYEKELEELEKIKRGILNEQFYK